MDQVILLLFITAWLLHDCQTWGPFSQQSKESLLLLLKGSDGPIAASHAVISHPQISLNRSFDEREGDLVSNIYAIDEDQHRRLAS